MKINQLILVLATCAFTIVSCSKSDNGGGTPTKPDLTAATEVAQSFSVIQLSTNNKAANGSGLMQISMSKLKEQRSQDLKKIVSDPSLCRTSSIVSGQDGLSKPGEFEMTMNITGRNCPLNARFYSKNVSKQGSGSLNIDFSFTANTLSAQNSVAARSGKVVGSYSFGINPSSNPNSEEAVMAGSGKFDGSVDSINHGNVKITMNFLMKIILKSDSTKGFIEESAKFIFGDESKNVTLKKLSNYSGTLDNPSEDVVYTANNAVITKEEYEDILGGISSSNGNNEETMPSPTQNNPSLEGR